MIELTRALRHLRWADDWMFDRIGELPPEAMLARYAESWTVARLAIHIVGGAEWYRYCLTGEPETDLTPPSVEPVALQEFVLGLRPHLADLDGLLLSEAEAPDATVSFVDEGTPRAALRSTILTQACLHGIEHRAQIACALEVSGYSPLPLDDVDLWAFERYERDNA